MSTLVPLLRRTTLALALGVATLVSVLGLVAAAVVARPALEGDAPAGPRVAGRLPDLALVLEPAPPAAAGPTLVAAAAGTPGVAAAGLEPVAGDGPAVLLVTLDGAVAAADVAPALRRAVADAAPLSVVRVGGRAVADVALADAVQRGVLLAVAPAAALAAAAAAVALGSRRGLALGVAAGGSLVAAWAVDAVRPLPVDGTVGRGLAPLALAALGASVTCALWIVRGDGLGTPAWRRAELVVPPVVVAALAGAAVAAFGEAASLTRAAAGLAIGAAVGVAAGVVAGAAAPVLPAAAASGPGSPAVDPAARSADGAPAGPLRASALDLVPDGRRFPAAVLLGFAAVLVVLAAAAPGRARTDLLDGDDVTASGPGAVARALDDQLGGDPTSGLLVGFPADADPDSAALWARSVSTLPGIATVEVGGRRWAEGAVVEGPAAAGNAWAMVVAADGGRAEPAQRLAAMVARISGPEGPVAVSGPGAEARATAERQGRLLPATLAGLALASALVVLVLRRDARVALASGALRGAALAAGIGAVRLAGGPVNAAELEPVVAVVGSLALLFDASLAASARRAERVGHPPAAALDLALGRSGLAAICGLAVVAGAGLAVVGGELDVLRRVGVALVVAVALVVVVELWLLRPALSVARPARRTAGHRALRDGAVPAPVPVEVAWRRTVTGLLRAEFLCQRDPDGDGLADVVVAGSSLWVELDEHQRALREAGVRVEGPPPRLVDLEVVRAGSPATLLVTIAHADRVLVDRSGRPVEQRPAHLRRGMLWLVRDPSGRHRLGEVVDLGTVTADAPVVAATPVAVAAAVPATPPPGLLPAPA